MSCGRATRPARCRGAASFASASGGGSWRVLPRMREAVFQVTPLLLGMVWLGMRCQTVRSARA